MADNKYRGDAQGRAQIDKYVAANVQVGDEFTLTCNGKDLTYAAEEATAANVYAGLSALVGQRSTVPEFREVTALLEYDGVEALFLQGPDDGTPFTITSSATNGGAPGVDVDETTAGVAGQNCKQTVEVTATGGTFTLTFLSSTTGTIAYNASAATVQTALRALASIGSTGCSVTDGGTSGDTRRWVVEFTGPLANVTQPLLTGSGSGLTGVIDGVVTPQQNGAPATNHKFSLEVLQETSLPTSPSFRFEFTNPNTGTTTYVTVTIAAGTVNNASLIQSKLASMANIGSGNVVVTRASQSGNTSVYTIEFVNTLGGTDLTADLLATAQTAGTTVSIETSQTGSATTVNEKQVLSFDAVPGGGTFTITYAGQTTGSINYNASAGDVQTALEGLSNIGSGDVSVTKATSGGMPYWTVEFTGALAATDLPLMTMTTTSITGGPVIITLTQEGTAATNEVQTITLTGDPTGGTFTLTFDGDTTGNIAYDADAAVIHAELEGLTSIGVGNLDVSGLPGGPWTITFEGALAGADVELITGDATNLTVGVGSQSFTRSSVVTPTGPYHWDNAENWSLGSVPVDADTVVFENTSNSCLYGLAQGLVTPAGFRIEASFTGTIGLPDLNGNGYYEYRAKRLRIGNAGSLYIQIGAGVGAGSSRIRLDTGSGCAVTIDVSQTAQPIEDGVGSVDWVGTNASNVIRVYRGSFTSAVGAAETATISAMEESYVDSQGSDADVWLGPGVTLTNLTKCGGTLDCECGISGTLTHYAGESIIRGTGAVGTINGYGGSLEYATSGTLTNGHAYGDFVGSFDRDRRSRTVTNNLTVKGDDADWRDQFKSVHINGTSPAALVIEYSDTTRFPNLGRDVTITREN